MKRGVAVVGYFVYVLFIERLDADPSMMRTDDYRGRYCQSDRWFGLFQKGFTRHT